MTVNSDPAASYAKSADDEQAYRIPEKQADLASLRNHLGDAVRDQQVLELACGSGYWTAVIAESAASVLATDIDPDMIKRAAAKSFARNNVRFAQADAFDLQVEGTFSACFIGFFWSRIKRQDQADFIARLRSKLGKDGLLVLLDDAYIDDGSMPIARTDAEGNTYRIHVLPSGERREVVRNFPTDSALRKKLGPLVKDIRIVRLTHYWMLTCRLK